MPGLTRKAHPQVDSRPSEDQAAYAGRGRSVEGLALRVPSLSDPDRVARDQRDPQLTAFLTISAMRASTSAFNSVSANEVGHISPSSRFALSLKPSVAYRLLNFCASWKKQTTLSPLA